MYTITGTMERVELEGGCWQFADENGNHYELIGENLDELYQNGVKATIVVRDAVGVASICMVGKIVEVVEIVEVSQ